MRGGRLTRSWHLYPGAHNHICRPHPVSCVLRCVTLGDADSARLCVCAGPAATDGMLRWFEAYAAALGSGRFAVELLDPELPQSRAITLYPQVRACPQLVERGGGRWGSVGSAAGLR